MTRKNPRYDAKWSQPAGWKVTLHPEWLQALVACQLTADALCTQLAITRRQAAAMVKRAPTRVERLAMAAIYHRLGDRVTESARCVKSGPLAAPSAAEPNARGRISKESTHGLA
jgi:hypothetical protein